MFTDLFVAILVALILAPLLAVALRWRAPGRRNTPIRSLLGFFLPTLLMAWGAVGVFARPGLDPWGGVWMILGGMGVFVGVLLADKASPPAPTRKERRRAERRGELLDPVYFLYVAALGVGLLAAGVTRMTFAELA